MAASRARDLLEHADLIVNRCGATQPDPHQRRNGCLVYVQTDPAFDQVNLSGGDATTHAFVREHDLHFTYGWNIGEPGCPVPTGGTAWRKTHPPVLVDLWESPPRPQSAWRTIATYRNRGKDIFLDGERFLWSKHPSFEGVMDLPSRTRQTLEIALILDDAGTRQRFEDQGWSLRDPYSVSCTASTYRRYLRGAKGEFSVEKDSYVRLRTGWFSDRTVCLLASGRPCVIQDTGFRTRLPSDTGLLAWSTVDEAAEALERAARDYELHAKAALELAREFFDAEGLLGPILEAAGL
jgi:hypothetical protein